MNDRLEADISHIFAKRHSMMNLHFLLSFLTLEISLLVRVREEKIFKRTFANFIKMANKSSLIDYICLKQATFQIYTFVFSSHSPMCSFLITQMFFYFSLFIYFLLPGILGYGANLLTKITPEENEKIQKMCKNGEFTGRQGRGSILSIFS
jgi:hypothetical protein